MYKVYCDGLLLYHSKLENLQIFNPSLNLRSILITRTIPHFKK